MKIAIVNDVAMIAEALRRIIVNTREHQVIWVAQSGQQALLFCAENRPDLILMDMIMPDMDGVETTRLIMQHSPCAILVVTASPEHNTNLVFRAMGAGALDVTMTPVMSGNSASDGALLAKIKTIGKLIKADAGGAVSGSRKRVATAGAGACGPIDTLVAIGASTGGPMALAKIFAGWKPPANCAVVVVQHIDRNFADSFAQWFADQVRYPVDVIEDGAPLLPGRILVAKTNDHVLLDEHEHLHYSAMPLDYPYRPSVNVFFQCVARHRRGNAIGVLLTGMGRDGAEGLLALKKAGKLTIAQDQASSAVYGMPRAAAELGAADLILPLDRIGATLSGKIGTRTAARASD